MCKALSPVGRPDDDYIHPKHQSAGKSGIAFESSLSSLPFPFLPSGTVHGAFGTGQQAARECVQFLQSEGITSASSSSASAATSTPTKPERSGNRTPSFLNRHTDSLAGSTAGLEVSESLMQNEVAPLRMSVGGIQPEHLGRRKLAARL